MDPEYVVVGAGIIGTSIARHLARYGASVVILEAGSSGSGATGASIGMVRCYDRDPLVMRLAAASLPVYADDRAWTGGVRPLRQAGAVTIASPEDKDSLDKAERRLRAVPGIEGHVVAGEENILGVHTSGGVAFVERNAGWIRPNEVTQDPIAQARNDGALLVTRCRVTEIQWDGSRLRLQTTRETVHARVVVLALGAWPTRPPHGVTAPPSSRARAIQVSALSQPDGDSAHATFIDLRTGGYGKPSDDGWSFVGAPLLVWGEDPHVPVPADPAPPSPDHRDRQSQSPSGRPLLRCSRWSGLGMATGRPAVRFSLQPTFPVSGSPASGVEVASRLPWPPGGRRQNCWSSRVQVKTRQAFVK